MEIEEKQLEDITLIACLIHTVITDTETFGTEAISARAALKIYTQVVEPLADEIRDLRAGDP